ncbi:hypothetical protein C8T65DRAFT_603238 [Cerioporus squamosus]|nr:hypothetical protein C8T65DRAFT_603238 [Cerioporus squamosus]
MVFMAHTLLPAKFEPERSAYWLPKSGQLAASRLPTRRFWGLRTCFNDQERDNRYPPWLFVVSSFPSPYPVENASYSLGPKVVRETGAIVRDDAEILTTTPIPTTEERASWPLFLHLLPAILINVYRSQPLRLLYFTLTEDSFRTFYNGVERCVRAADANAREALATHGFEKIKNDWNAPQLDGNHGAYMFGETIDPHSYVFDFDPELPPGSKLPSFEGPSVVYDELMLYNQLCKDYNWRGADHAVDWVEDMRNNAGRGWVLNPDTLTTVVPTEPHPEGELRERAIELAALDNPHVRIASVLDDRHAKRMELARSAGLDSTYSSSSSDVEFLPRRFPHIPFRYPVVPFGITRVIVFDIFGTIMDREKVIAAALKSWAILSPIRHTVSMDTVVGRFLTFEALAEREAEIVGSPTSLATFARSALMELARDLYLDIDERSPFVTETLKHILSPMPYADVQTAITTLKERGYTLVCLPAHSATTMQQLRPSLPPAFADSEAVRTWTKHISAHFVAPASLFSSLHSFCESLVEGALQPSEILVVSSGIGRVLHAALCAGHATAWVRRPGNLEGEVDFVVGDDENSCPVPSLMVSGLMELVASL